MVLLLLPFLLFLFCAFLNQKYYSFNETMTHLTKEEQKKIRKERMKLGNEEYDRRVPMNISLVKDPKLSQLTSSVNMI